MPHPIPHLETITAKDLLTRPIEPLGFTIADILLTSEINDGSTSAEDEGRRNMLPVA